MNTTTPPTANQTLVREQVQQRILRLVVSSRRPDRSIPEIDEVLQSCFHSSHSHAVALVRYTDDTCGLVFVVYRGDVHAQEIEVPGVVARALQLEPPKVGLRLDGTTVQITATDVYGKSQSCSWLMSQV